MLQGRLGGGDTGLGFKSAVKGRGNCWVDLASPVGGQAHAENEFPSFGAVFLCSAFANTS